MAAKEENKIVFSTDLYWGQRFFLVNDPDQEEYRLIGVKLLPGVTDKKGNQIPSVKFRLESVDTKLWVYDFMCSTEKDALLSLKKSEEGDDDD